MEPVMNQLSINEFLDFLPQYESMIQYQGAYMGSSSSMKWAKIFNQRVSGKNGSSKWGIQEYQRGSQSFFIQFLLFDGRSDGKQATMMFTIQIVKRPNDGFVIAQNERTIIGDYMFGNGELPHVELVRTQITDEIMEYSLWIRYDSQFQAYSVVPFVYDIGQNNMNAVNALYDTRVNRKLRLDMLFEEFITKDAITESEYTSFKSGSRKTVYPYPISKAPRQINAPISVARDTIVVPNVSQDFSMVTVTGLTDTNGANIPNGTLFNISKLQFDKSITNYTGYRFYMVFYTNNITLKSMIGYEAASETNRTNKMILKGAADKTPISGTVIEFMRINNYWVEM